MSPFLTKLSDQVLDILERWRDGLVSCMSPAVKRHFMAERSPYVLALGDQEGQVFRDSGEESKLLGQLSVEGSSADKMLIDTLQRSKEPFVLRVPSEWVLRKRVPLPTAAMENLRQVISFEMDRFTPFSVGQVYFDYHVEDVTDADQVLVDVALVPRNRLKSWFSMLETHRIKPHVLTSELWPRANLLPLEDRPRINFLSILAGSWPYALLLVLLVAALIQPLIQKQEVLAQLSDTESSLKVEAEAVSRTRNALEQSEHRLRSLLETKRQSAPALEVIRVLTELIPDDTWVQQLDIKGGRVEIRGLSEQSSVLLKILEDSRGFKDVTFLSSVVQQRGKERFHLGAEIMNPFPRDIIGIRLPEETPEEESTEQPGENSTDVGVIAESEALQMPGDNAREEVPKRDSGMAESEGKAPGEQLPDREGDG